MILEIDSRVFVLCSHPTYHTMVFYISLWRGAVLENISTATYLVTGNVRTVVKFVSGGDIISLFDYLLKKITEASVECEWCSFKCKIIIANSYLVSFGRDWILKSTTTWLREPQFGNNSSETTIENTTYKLQESNNVINWKRNSTCLNYIKHRLDRKVHLYF